MFYYFSENTNSNALRLGNSAIVSYKRFFLFKLYENYVILNFSFLRAYNYSSISQKYSVGIYPPPP